MRRFVICLLIMGVLHCAAFAQNPESAQDADVHSHDRQAAMDMSGMNMSSTEPAWMPSPHVSSGTGWQPASSPAHEWMKSLASWEFMAHGVVFVDYNQQGGPRGEGKAESVNWLMLMQQHAAAGGTLLFREMFSAESLTAPHPGFPELFQTGETYHGQPLVDHQHPHNVFSEMALYYTHPIYENISWLFYGAAAGEPALGPVAYVHRVSAAELPMAPLSHHLQDSTHISFGVLTTGLTIGSGGSGGVFAPGLVIGGMAGGVLWNILHIYPAITPTSPSAFVIVGMMALFGGIAKVPLAVILMVSEMTMDYTLLIPSMLACSIAYFVTGDNYLYEKQVNVRAESPAHRHEYSIMLLKGLRVKEAMISDVPTIGSESTVKEVADLLKGYDVHAVPVVDESKLIGIVAKLDTLKSIYEDRSEVSVSEIMSSKLVVTYPDESLFDAMNKMILHHISQLPVVERTGQSKLLGLVSLDDVTRIQCVCEQ